MNKNDLKLIVLLLFLVSLSISFYLFNNERKAKKAIVYYENNLILTIDLGINKNYIVEGYNGEVEIVVKDNKIKVVRETSPYHLCSKQGYISNSYEVIICLPNKIIIEIESMDNYDTVVR